MARFVLVLAIITLYIYAFLDLARADSREVRLIPKWLWAVVMLVVLILGPALWLALGRPKVEYPPSGGNGGGGGSGPGGRGPGPRGPVAPDDDPEFLKKLDEQSWSDRMERLRNEREGGAEPPPREGQPPASDGSDVSGA